MTTMPPATHPITGTITKPLVAPSILSADFADLGADCRAVMEAGGPLAMEDVLRPCPSHENNLNPVSYYPSISDFTAPYSD